MLSRRLLRIKVIKALYAHFKSEVPSPDTSEKNLFASADKAYDLYLQILWLPVEVMRLAERRIEAGRNKKLPTPEDLNPNTKFIDNALIRRLETSDSLIFQLEKRSLGWAMYPELVKSLYGLMVESDYYKEYMAAPRSWASDVKVVADFFALTAEDNAQLEDAVEEQSIMWADDVDFALILAVRTAEQARENDDDIRLLPQYKNDDDRRFTAELFRTAVIHHTDYMALVEGLASNWDSDRIAFMDGIIMSAAVAELVTFESIPVKVTLDEYIEIAKHYSTAGSGNFINGVLDKAVEKLTAEGKIRKSGRGLR